MFMYMYMYMYPSLSLFVPLHPLAVLTSAHTDASAIPTVRLQDFRRRSQCTWMRGSDPESPIRRNSGIYPKV